MANKTIGQLDELTPNSSSLFAIYDTEVNNGATGKATVEQILNTAIDMDGTGDAVSIPERLASLSEDIHGGENVDGLDSRVSSLETVLDGNDIIIAGDDEISEQTEIQLADYLGDIFLCSTYTYLYELNVEDVLGIDSEDFNFTTPNGYSPIAVLKADSSQATVGIESFNGCATGQEPVLVLKNTSSTTPATGMASIVILYCKTNLIG